MEKLKKNKKLIIILSIVLAVVIVLGSVICIGIHKHNKQIAEEQGKLMFEKDKQKNQEAIDKYLDYAEYYIKLAETTQNKSSKEDYKNDSNKYLEQATELATFMTDNQFKKWYDLTIRKTLL